MYTYYVLFYFLDLCFVEMRGEMDDDVAGLLGAMSPDLWGDGMPIDMGCVENWRQIEDNNKEKNMIEKICLYLRLYETDAGFSCRKTLSFIWSLNDKGEPMLQTARKKATHKFEQD